ncbi:MAG: hypothetical protein AAFN92_07700 [Bacteroidota bacterium]
MTAQEFNQYLEAPERLYELPLTNLQQLALRYPYSPNLRLLLLLKARLEDHPAEAAFLERCAAASFDRAFLYDILRELDDTGTISGDEATETLELRELDELQAELLPADAALPDTALLTDTAPLPAPEELPSPAPAPAPPPPAISVPPPPRKASPVFDPVSWAATATAYLTSLPATPSPATDPPAETTSPQRPDAFPITATTGPTPSLRQRLHRIRNIQQQRQDGSRDRVNRIARRSLVTHDAVASETLARLLTQQGQYQHAIKMYRRLILLYPEKKTIFAGLIKDLQKKI